MHIYDFHDYNDSGTLKVSLGMWLLILYTLRHAVLWLGLSIISFSHAIELMRSFTNEVHWLFFISDIPGLMVLFAALNRITAAGRTLRWIWHYGKYLLISALILHMGISIGLAAMKPIWYEAVPYFILSLDIVGIVYLYRSKRATDVFIDFPPPEPVKGLGNQSTS